MHRPPTHTAREFAPFLYSANPDFDNLLDGPLVPALEDCHAYDAQWFSDTDTLQIEFPSFIEKARFMRQMGLEVQEVDLTQPSATLLRVSRLHAFIAQAKASENELIRRSGEGLEAAIAQANALKAAAEVEGLPPVPPPAPQRVSSPRLVWGAEAEAYTAPECQQVLAAQQVNSVLSFIDRQGGENFYFAMPNAQSNEALQQYLFGRVIVSPSEENRFSLIIPFSDMAVLREREVPLAGLLIDQYQAMTGRPFTVRPAAEHSEEEEDMPTPPKVELFPDRDGRRPFHSESEDVAQRHFNAIVAALNALKDDPKNEIALEEKGHNEYSVKCTTLNSKPCDVEATLKGNSRSVTLEWEKGRYEDFYRMTAMTVVQQAKSNPAIRQFKLNISPEGQAEKLREALAEVAAENGLAMGLRLNGIDYRWDAEGKRFSAAPSSKPKPPQPEEEAEEDDLHDDEPSEDASASSRPRRR